VVKISVGAHRWGQVTALPSAVVGSCGFRVWHLFNLAKNETVPKVYGVLKCRFAKKKQDVQSFVALFCPQIKQKTSTAVTTPLW